MLSKQAYSDIQDSDIFFTLVHVSLFKVPTLLLQNCFAAFCFYKNNTFWTTWVLSLDSKHFKNKKKIYILLQGPLHCPSMKKYHILSIFSELVSSQGDRDLVLMIVAWISFEHRSVHPSTSDPNSIFSREKCLNKHSSPFIWFSCPSSAQCFTTVLHLMRCSENDFRLILVFSQEKIHLE